MRQVLLLLQVLVCLAPLPSPLVICTSNYSREPSDATSCVPSIDHSLSSLFLHDTLGPSLYAEISVSLYTHIPLRHMPSAERQVLAPPLPSSARLLTYIDKMSTGSADVVRQHVQPIAQDLRCCVGEDERELLPVEWVYITLVERM